MRAIVLFLVAVLCCGSVGAQVPREINYQGYLTATGGTPVTGMRSMDFNLYTVSTGGVAPYTETQQVTVTNGLFNVRIGSVLPIPDTVLFDQPYYLGVRVGADAEMTPRQLVTPAPVALSLPGLYTRENATSPNLVGGSSSNSVGPAVVGGVIGGGGSSDGPNDVRANYGTIPGGRGGLADHYGQQAYASGHFQYPGDAQASLLVLRGLSSNGATVTLSLDGAGALAKMAPQRNMLANILVVGRSENDLSAGYARDVLIDRTLSSIFVNGNTANTPLTTVYEDAQAVPWSCWVRPDSASLTALIQCAGASAQDVRFVATVRTAEVQWNNGASPP